MFYQLCYVDEPEVQRLVHENDGQVGYVILSVFLIVTVDAALFDSTFHLMSALFCTCFNRAFQENNIHLSVLS